MPPQKACINRMFLTMIAFNRSKHISPIALFFSENSLQLAEMFESLGRKTEMSLLIKQGWQNNIQHIKRVCLLLSSVWHCKNSIWKSCLYIAISLLRLNRMHNNWKQIKRVSQRHISLYRTKYTYCHSGFWKRLLSTKSSPHILNKLESRREKWYKRVLNNIWINSCNITVCGFGKWKLI